MFTIISYPTITLFKKDGKVDLSESLGEKYVNAK